MNEKMKGLTLENIAKACGGTYVGPENLKTEEIRGAVMDSRQIEEGFLFLAIKGEKVDGHDFVPSVFEKGALAVLVERAPEVEGPYILVESTLLAIKKIAAFYRTQLTIPVVGITGSVGKTSTKEMIATVLEQKFSVLKTAGNFNNELGLPLTMFRIQPSHEVAVLEMGISDFGEMDRLATMDCPDYMVITNVGYCHLEFLGDRDGVLKAKTECFAHMTGKGYAILNGDDDKLITKTEAAGKTSLFYGVGEASETKDIKKQVYATDVENLGFEGMTCTIHTPEGSFDAKIAIPGEHNVHNALAATAVGLALGMKLDEIQAGISAARTIAGRTNFLQANGMIVIDDCYNANPVSMKSSLAVLAHAKGRSIAVLGDMGELGADEAALHAEVGASVGENKIHALFAAGELAENYAKAAIEANPDCDVRYFKTREEMTEALLAYVKPGDSILVKASHFMQFPEVVKALTEA